MNESQRRHLRERLLGMRDRLREEIGRRGQAIIDDVQDPGAHSRLPTHLADHDDEGVQMEIEVGEAQTELLDEVESALERLGNGRYGRCRTCGRAIGGARLAAVPFTSWCIDCERRRERAAREGR